MTGIELLILCVCCLNVVALGILVSRLWAGIQILRDQIRWLNNRADRLMQYAADDQEAIRSLARGMEGISERLDVLESVE